MKTEAKSNSVILPLGPTFVTAYGPKNRQPMFFPPEEGKTKQEFKDECDIHSILKRYQETRTAEHINHRQAVFADVTALDFQTAMNVMADARSAFASLPSEVRDRFKNDPAELLAFVEDEANAEEAAELGLLSPEGIAAIAQRAKDAEAAEIATAAPAAPATPAAAPAAPAPAK